MNCVLYSLVLRNVSTRHRTEKVRQLIDSPLTNLLLDYFEYKNQTPFLFTIEFSEKRNGNY